MTLFPILLCVLSVPVWPAGREAEMNGFYRFRADVPSDTATGGLLRATAGYAYRAYVNGEFVGYGPARAAPGFFRVDEWPVKLAGGANVVELEVAGYNCNNFYLPMQTPFLQAEVVVGGRVVAKTAADGEFRALTTGRVRKVPRFSYQRPFMEVYRLPHAADGPLALQALPAVRLLPREWAYPDFRVTDPFSPRSLERVVRDETVRTKSERYIVSTQGNYRYFPPGELEENPFYDIQRLKTVSRTAPPAAESAESAEKVTEHGTEIHGTEIHSTAHATVFKCRMTILIVLPSFVGIAQNSISFSNFLKFLFCFLITGIYIRMIFFSQLSVSLLYLIGRSSFLYAKDLIIITLFSHVNLHTGLYCNIMIRA